MSSEPGICASCGERLPDSAASCPRCSPPATEAQTVLPSIPGYALEQLLGQGGMGTVYLAEDETLHRRVAVAVDLYVAAKRLKELPKPVLKAS